MFSGVELLSPWSADSTLSPAVYLSGVSLSFGAVGVLHNADLHIRRGEKVALTGPSGAGKTSLLAIAAGLLRPSGGIVRTCGMEVNNMNEDARAAMRRDNIGVVFQHFHLLESMTAAEKCCSAAGTCRQQKRRRYCPRLSRRRRNGKPRQTFSRTTFRRRASARCHRPRLRAQTTTAFGG